MCHCGRWGAAATGAVGWATHVFMRCGALSVIVHTCKQHGAARPRRACSAYKPQVVQTHTHTHTCTHARARRPTTCGGCIASEGHEDQDVATFADWGVEYLKVDSCSRNCTPAVSDKLLFHQRHRFWFLGFWVCQLEEGAIPSIAQFSRP